MYCVTLERRGPFCSKITKDTKKEQDRQEDMCRLGISFHLANKKPDPTCFVCIFLAPAKEKMVLGRNFKFNHCSIMSSE